MKTQHNILLGIILTLIACQTAKKKSEQNQIVKSEESLIVGDIDTTKIISQLAIKESGSRLDLSNEKLENLSNQLDTSPLLVWHSLPTRFLQQIS